MNKIISTKTSAIFLATMLIVGTIAAFSPSFMIASAQAELYYGQDNNYKKSYGKDVTVKSVKCNNINVNVNGLELDGLPPFLGNLTSDGETDGYGDARSYGNSERSYGSGGQSGYDNKNSFKFICINNNNNTVIGVDDKEPIPPEPPILPPPEPETCEECFTQVLSEAEILAANEILSSAGLTLVVGGEIIEITSIDVLCETLDLIPGGLARTNTENILDIALPGNAAAFPAILDCLESLGLVFS